MILVIDREEEAIDMKSGDNMFTFDTKPKERLSGSDSSKDNNKFYGKMNTQVRQQQQLRLTLQESKNSSDSSLSMPISRSIFLRKRYHIVGDVSRGDVVRRGISRRRVTAPIKEETAQRKVHFHQRLNSKRNSMLSSTISHPFNTIYCLAVCRSVACCNSLTIDFSPTKVWHRQSFVCSMAFVAIFAALATLFLQPVVAGQQISLRENHDSDRGQSLPDSYQAEKSETVLWQTGATAAAATTSGSQQKKTVEQEEIPKLSEQHQSKSKDERQQRTSYHDSDLHLDSLHSSLSQSINLSKQQQQQQRLKEALAEEGEEEKEQTNLVELKGDESPLKRPKRSSKDYGATEDIEEQVRELQLERRRKPVLVSSSGRESNRNLALEIAPRNVWQPARYRRLDDSSTTLHVNDQATNLESSSSPLSSSENLTGECNRILKFWASFKFSYPSLAAHLIKVHSTEVAPQNVANQFSFKMAQLIKSIARLLNEAELLARSSATKNNKQTNPWLSRVLANPMYAKIVSQFTSKHFPTTNQQFVAKLQQQQLKANNELINNHMIEANQQEQQKWNNSDGYVYGRVIHYPHELSANDGSSSAKTLQKLRELSNSRKLITGDSSRSGESQPDREFESNKIQAMLDAGSKNGGDGEPWMAGDSHKSKDFPVKNYNSDPDEARNKFVYGSILLKPNQNSGNHNLPQRHQNSIETLRQLQQGGLDHQSSVPASESYGRVLVSPASLSGQQNERLADGDNQHHRIGDVRKQPSMINNQQQQDHDRWSSKSTLDKLKQKLNTNSNRYESANNFEQSASSENGNADELSEQEHGNSMAVHSNPDLVPHSDSSNEFEGDWHSGPLQQVEVRQPRNDGLTAIHTTLSPRDVFIIE